MRVQNCRTKSSGPQKDNNKSASEIGSESTSSGERDSDEVTECFVFV